MTFSEPGDPSPDADARFDQTVDFAAEILNTPSAELPDRIRRLPPQMRTTVFVEVARRYRDMVRQKAESDRELQNLRYHAERLEKMLLDMAREKGT